MTESGGATSAMATIAIELIKQEGPGFKMVLSDDHSIENGEATFTFSSCNQNLCC